MTGAMAPSILRFDGEHRFLSNFFMFDGTSVEHAYQSLKATNDQDRRWVLAADRPGEAKNRGRSITCREDWEDVRLSIMEKAVRIKFSRPELREKLLATGDKRLVEGNHWHDNFWGNCICKDCRSASGENHLGEILMRIREEIR